MQSRQNPYFITYRTLDGIAGSMGRKTILLGFAFFGYLLGFLGWLLRGSFAHLIADFGANQEIADAVLAGIAGGFLMVVAVVVWAAVD